MLSNLHCFFAFSVTCEVVYMRLYYIVFLLLLSPTRSFTCAYRVVLIPSVSYQFVFLVFCRCGYGDLRGKSTGAVQVPCVRTAEGDAESPDVSLCFLSLVMVMFLSLILFLWA